MDRCLLGANNLLGLHGDERGSRGIHGDGGRDGIPREHCGGGEGELNISTTRERFKHPEEKKE